MSTAPALTVDPEPTFELSPYLFMQFMEPLGTTDGSVEAAWDFARSRWREDLVRVARRLAPPLIRWGGCLASYYRWKEAVGPRRRRVPMRNLLWGGVQTNQVGTHEFVDFCRQVRAEPMFVVNFESDGRRHWARPAEGGVRSARAAEAAEWVDYCNNPDNPHRRRNGAGEPFGLRTWQIGNETSYDPNGFDCATAAAKTLTFARAMHRADPRIDLIAWGDNGWAGRMIEVAGEHLKYIAMHHGFRSSLGGNALAHTRFRKDPQRTWRHLMSAWKSTAEKIRRARAELEGSGKFLAITEGHFSLPGRNRSEVLATWGAGVANARILNVHARNGDLLKIATLADFCGTRWMVNAIIMPTPGRTGAYMMPVARVMSLFRRHGGSRACRVTGQPKDLDVTASRRGSRVFLHAVNVSRTEPIAVRLKVQGARIASGRIFEIACDPTFEVDETCPDALEPVERRLGRSGRWRLPPASVSAVELTLAKPPPRRARPRGRA